MKLTGTLILTALLGPLSWVHAQLELLTDARSAMVFGSGAREIQIRWQNPRNETTTAEIRARIFQTSSVTAALFSETRQRQIEVLPHQTVLESVNLNFPAVKAETKFLVQWLDNTNRIIGTTEIWVYPTNLLAELKPLLDGETLGVLDPDNEFKPVLKQNGVEFTDLGQMALEEFSGRLAILGPVSSKAQMRSGLAGQIKALAKKSVAVVWLLPPLEKADGLLPSFYSIAAGTNAVVVAQAEMVSRLPENPQAQLNLVHFCKQALNPVPLSLPNLTKQP